MELGTRVCSSKWLRALGAHNQITTLRRDMKSQLKIVRRRILFATEALWVMFFVVSAMIEDDGSNNRISVDRQQSLACCVEMKRRGNLNQDYDQPWASNKGVETLGV